MNSDLETDSQVPQEPDQNQQQKYPDRGNNKGLIGNIIKPKNTSDNSSPSTNQNQLQEITGQIKSATKSITGKLKDLFLSKDEPTQQIAPEKKNPADNYPDPTFIDKKYQDKTYQIPLNYLNNKSSPENFHIPPYDLNAEYKILFLMFQKVKDPYEIFSFRAMLDYINDKNLLNARDQYGNTLLMYAVRYKNNPAVKSLLSNGANPNVCNASGICPIHIAIFNKEYKIFDFLIKSYTDLTIKTPDNIDPLLYSIYGNNFYAFKALINHKSYSMLTKKDYEFLLKVVSDSQNENQNSDIYEYLLRKIEESQT